eukprot:TRINITY_DN7369_c0_g1_i3.p1 TRINITY_DN7369_c0_g1~~TRINITY_DN7369_c0_g1_i3.p1  ORF type:complete len:416 (-),score=81.17 TRINITY_DN7369_c0_g1_i3:102-1349(-)
MAEAAKQLQQLEELGAGYVVGLTALWLLISIAPHWEKGHAWELKRFYVRKLRRMQLYCAVAAVAGIVLGVSCLFAEEPLVALLSTFGPVHQVFFTMAIAHWTVNIWEDWQTRALLSQGLSEEGFGGLALFPLNLCCGPDKIMLCMYFVHHIASVFAYAYSLCTKKLGGVMVQGLLFELPVVLMLRRELAQASEEPPGWFRKPSRVRAHWCLTYVAFVAGRGPAEVLWLVSMLPGYGSRRLRQELSEVDVVVYHTLAVFFTSINIRMFGLFFCWHEQDATRALELWKEDNGITVSDKATETCIADEPAGATHAALPLRISQTLPPPPECATLGKTTPDEVLDPRRGLNLPAKEAPDADTACWPQMLPGARVSPSSADLGADVGAVLLGVRCAAVEDVHGCPAGLAQEQNRSVHDTE